MKPKFVSHSIFNRATLCASLSFGLGASAKAQVILNSPGDAAGQSSWAAAGRWSDGLAPSASKDYVNNVSLRLLRSPNNSTTSTVFAGKSLTIANGAVLIHKGNSNTTITIFDLRLDNGGDVRVVDNGRTLTVDGNIAIQAGGGEFAVTQNLGTTMVIASTVSGSGPLSKIDVGTVRLDGNFTGYTGTFSVNAGAARFNSGFGGSIVVNSAAASFQAGVTVAGTLTGSATSTISGEPAITGNLALTGGTVVANASTPASLGTSGNLTLNGVTTISLADGPPSSTAPFTVLSYNGTLTGTTANLTLADAANYRNPVLSTATPKMITLAVGSENRTWTGSSNRLWDINASTNWLEGDQKFSQVDAVTFGDTGAGEVALTGVLSPASITINSSADYNFTAAAGNLIAGAASLTKSGTGTATIAGANTFSGGITVAGGTLRGGGFSQSFGANGQLITVQSGATFDFNDANTASRDFNAVINGAGVAGVGAIVNNGPAGFFKGLGSLTLAGNASIGGTAQWDVRPIVAGTGLIDLAGFTLTKTGSGNVNFVDSTLSADGGIEINEGSLTISRSDVSGSGNINVNSGAALRFVNSTSGIFIKPIHLADNSAVSNEGADFTLGSEVTVTGNTRLEGIGNTLFIANPVVGTGNIEKTGTATVVLQTPLAHGGTTTITAGTLSLSSPASTVVDLIAKPISDLGTLGFGRANNEIDTIYTLAGTNAFQGNFSVASGIVKISSSGVLGPLAPDPVDPQAAPLPKRIQIINRNAGFHLDGSGGNLALPVGYNFVISNDVPDRPAIGNVAGDNTINGDISIGIGGGGGAISVFGGSLTLAGNIANSSTPRSVILGGPNGSGMVTGVISDGTNTLGLEKTGSNSWTLTGNNTYSGITTISGGTLQIGAGGASGELGSGAVINNASLVINRSGSVSLPGAISGTGSLTHSGSAFTILNANNTYTGDTLINAGTLSPSFASLADESTVRLSGSGTLDLVHGQTDTVKSLVIDGSPKAAGLWGRIGSIAALGANFESALITGEGLLNVTTSGSVPAPFQTWAATNITAVNAGADATAAGDPDRDGNTNLAEFALNGDPLSGASSGKVVGKIANVNGSPALVLTLPVRAAATFSGATEQVSGIIDGIIYTIQGSDELATWALAVSEVTGLDKTTIETGLPVLDSGWQYRTFQSPGTVAGDPRDFLRAVITQP